MISLRFPNYPLKINQEPNPSRDRVKKCQAGIDGLTTISLRHFYWEKNMAYFSFLFLIKIKVTGYILKVVKYRDLKYPVRWV